MFCGAQFSLYPMTDNFVRVIAGSVSAIKGRDGLRVESDDLSTLVVGPPQAVFAAVRDAYASACRHAGHVVLSATFSQGCPGEGDDPICTPDPPKSGKAGPAAPQAGEKLSIEVAAQFALYPLGIASHMDVIYREIGQTKKTGVYTRGKHFCSRLDGDLGAVFAAFERAFESAAHDAGHVVLTATVSKGSPSPDTR